MKSIHKFVLKVTDKQTIAGCLDNDAFISAGLDPSGKLCVWAEVDTDKQENRYDIHIVGTGNPRPASARYFIGSVLQQPFVWHVYFG